MLNAIFSDIHSNREAFDACLADADRRKAERFVFLGDLVGYGAEPGYIVNQVAQLRGQGAIVIKGNHDAAVITGVTSANRYAQMALDWTRSQLSEAQKSFLAGLPLTAELGDVLLVHAEASHPAKWVYITDPIDAERSMQATDKRGTLSGHTHRPCVYEVMPSGRPCSFVPSSDMPVLLAESTKWHAVIGSVGQPRDENSAAAYALYDDVAGSLTFQRTAYDIERAANKIAAAGLPEFLAARLRVGR